MKTIAEMLKPRASVFMDIIRDDVLNLSDFVENRIDGNKFFSENFRTQGMERLFEEVFKRFKGESDTGVIKLTQAMGGGKTHNMIALALLAKDPILREKILGRKYNSLGNIDVVIFSGRENAEYGIWGSIAEQLGRKYILDDYYSPLRAPGEKSWIKLLEDRKILILMDELPPYLENAKSIAIGNSDLCQVTKTALSNLFSALGKQQLSNVCLVFSDLKAAYESGSEILQRTFKDLENEANRVALEIAPVALNSDEVYSILHKRLFEDQKLCDNYDFEKNEIAISYKNAVEKSKKSGLTNMSPDNIYQGVKDSYPFHPSIKELYARFKENQGFQQTRGLIKLMRQIVRQIWESGLANKSYIINVFDVDFNNQNLMSMFKQIKPSLEVAISHDIAQNGKAVAEIIDNDKKSEDYTQKISKLIFISSLSTATHATLGLTPFEICGYMCAPNIDIDKSMECLEELKSHCWYLKSDNSRKLYFQNTKNMIASINSYVDSYNNESAKKELKGILEETFRPNSKLCYESLYVLPAIDEISLDSKKITLIIFEPYPGNTLNPELEEFYNNCSCKNCIMFLSGNRKLMDNLYWNSKRVKAIKSFFQEIKDSGTPSTDQQYKEAEALKDKLIQALYSTIRETFVKLYYPTKNGIESADIKFEFKSNKFDGEEQIINVLQENQKYVPYSNKDDAMEEARKKCESRIFTLKEMKFSQLKERAATETSWQWYHPDMLESLKTNCLKRDKWRENEGYITKGPFEKDPTSIIVKQINYDDDKEEFTLSIKAIGGQVYYDIGAEPTEASKKIEETVFHTKEPQLNFICIDSTKERKTGKIFIWTGEPTIKYNTRMTSNGQAMEIKTHRLFEVKYTTDGSEPKENGGIYNGEFIIPQDTKFVNIVLLYKDNEICRKHFEITKKNNDAIKSIDDNRELQYKFQSAQKFDDTESVYKEFENLSRIPNLRIKGADIYLFDKNNEDIYIDYQANVSSSIETIKNIMDFIRDESFKNTDIIITFEYKALLFKCGKDFKSWIDICHLDLDKLIKEGGNATMKKDYYGFGFNPKISENHFYILIDSDKTKEVCIYERFGWDKDLQEIKKQDILKLKISRYKWSKISMEVTKEFNRRLREEGIPTSRFLIGGTPLEKLYGKELMILLWAIENNDPSGIPTAIRNWMGLLPEERWWLYTITNASTGDINDKKGWRMALRYALCENPVEEKSQITVFDLTGENNNG